jgi:hypothetical protein
VKCPNIFNNPALLLTFFTTTSILQSGDKAYALCFVEFSDAKCARTAMGALQGSCFSAMHHCFDIFSLYSFIYLLAATLVPIDK